MACTHACSHGMKCELRTDYFCLELQSAIEKLSPSLRTFCLLPPPSVLPSLPYTLPPFTLISIPLSFLTCLLTHFLTYLRPFFRVLSQLSDLDPCVLNALCAACTVGSEEALSAGNCSGYALTSLLSNTEQGMFFPNGG